MSETTGRNESRAVERGGPTQLALEEQFIRPRVAVYEDQEAVYLELEMPGVTRDKIDVTVEKDELTVTGWRTPDDYSKFQVLRRERVPLSFRRAFVLSEAVDTNKISAGYNDGTLKLTLAKCEVAKPKKIAIE